MDPNLGPNGEINVPSNYQVYMLRGSEPIRGILKVPKAGGGSGPSSSHKTSPNPSNHSGSSKSLSQKRTRFDKVLSKSREDDTGSDYSRPSKFPTGPEELLVEGADIRPEVEVAQPQNKDDFAKLMTDPKYLYAASLQSTQSDVSGDIESCLPNYLKRNVQLALSERPKHSVRYLEEMVELREEVAQAIENGGSKADLRLKRKLGQLIRNIQDKTEHSLPGPSNPGPSNLTPEELGKSPGPSNLGPEEAGPGPLIPGPSNQTPEITPVIPGPSNKNPEITPASHAQGPLPMPSVEPPNEDLEVLQLGSNYDNFIKVTPLGGHFNTKIGKLKINPYLLVKLDPINGLPSSLKYGLEWNMVPDSPVRVSIHQGDGNGLHHAIEVSMRNSLLNLKGEVGTTNSINYWEAGVKVNLSKIQYVEAQSDRFKEWLPADLGRFWRTPSVGFGFGSNQSLKTQRLKDLQSLFLDVEYPCGDQGTLSGHMPLINKQVDFNEHIKMVRELAGLYGNPSIDQIKNITKLTTLLHNPLIANVGRALLIKNPSNTGPSGSSNSVRILNDNLNQIATQVDSLKDGNTHTRNLVERGINNQKNLLREIQNSNESDCCEEMIARLNRVESKIDNLTDGIKETEDDSPLKDLASGLILGGLVLFSKNLVITVVFSLTVGLVGGILNYHVIRITRKAQAQSWPSYPLILGLRITCTIFSTGTTVVLLGSRLNNVVTSQPPMTELPFLREIPFLDELLHPPTSGYTGVQWYLHKLPPGSHQFMTIVCHKFGAISLVSVQLVGVVFIFLRISKGGDLSKMILETVAVLLIQAKSVTVSNYIQRQDRDKVTWNDLPGFFHISLMDIFKYYLGLGAIVINALKRSED